MLSDIALYLIGIDILDNLKSCAKFILAMSLISIGIAFLINLVKAIEFYTDGNDSKIKLLSFLHTKYFKYLAIAVAICSVVTIIIPSKNVMYSAIALNAVDKAVLENKDVQELLGKSFEVLNLKLDEVLKDKSE